MRQIIKIVFIGITTLTIYCCDPADNRLKVINNSNVDIYFFYSCDTSLNDFTMFRNGFYHNAKGDSSYTISDQYVKRSSSQNIPLKGFDSWNHYLNECKDKKICFFIFTDSIVNKYTVEEIKNRRLYEECLIYSLDNLKKNEWSVSYTK